MQRIQKAIIKRGDRFLTLLRSPRAAYFPGRWDFPGGKLEDGEDPRAGIEREVFEETSLTIKVLKPTFVFEADLDRAGTPTHQFTLYETKIIAGEVRLSHEHSDWQWSSKEELGPLAVEPYIPAYFKSLEIAKPKA